MFGKQCALVIARAGVESGRTVNEDARRKPQYAAMVVLEMPWETDADN